MKNEGRLTGKLDLLAQVDGLRDVFELALPE